MMLEVENYVERLRDLHAEVFRVLEGLPPEGLNWSPLPAETNSVFGLATHCLGAERHWVHEFIGQRKVERDRAAEFRARGEDVSALQAAYAAAARESEQVLGRLVESDLQVLRGGEEKHSIRWIILHIVEHYNEHVGQMRLTRQMWENRSARPHEI
jgi:uncharacterized damage-inducible protein DinB